MCLFHTGMTTTDGTAVTAAVISCNNSSDNQWWQNLGDYCLFGVAVASMWMCESLRVESYGRDKKYGATVSGPGTYLIS